MKSSYNGQAVPAGGKLQVPDTPVIPFIEGDGTGRDIWKASRLVFDAAVEHAYDGKRRVAWFEVFAGEKAFNAFKEWLPDETVDAIRDFRVAIKGPLTTPVGGGIRSLNVALRQTLDLYVCLRPVRYFQGVPSPVKRPEKVDKVIYWLQDEMRVKKIRFPETSAIGIKPVSKEGSRRLIRAAINYAVLNGRRSVTLVHKGNIMKFTEGGFKNWGYELAQEEFEDVAVSWEECGGSPGDRVLVKDAIADICLQQVLTRP